MTSKGSENNEGSRSLVRIEMINTIVLMVIIHPPEGLGFRV